tara:strand:- start:5549 stop:5761 length:213 start_codon:yes stop_codon:yes gene_type:complete
MEKNYFQKLLKIIILISSIAMLLQLIACEDDAILEPELIKDCKPGDSYCNLSLPKTENYASIKINNPEIF